MTSPTEPSSSRSRRAPRAQPPRPQKNHALLWGGLLLFAVLASIGIKLAVSAATAVKTPVRVLDKDGKPLAKGKLEFFAYDDSASAPATPRKLGERTFENGAAVVVPEELVPEFALVRASADGLGKVSFLVHKGEHRENEAKLLPAVAIEGVVSDERGQMLGEAKVAAIGSGPTGLVLGEATSASDGTFKIDGVSPSMHHVALRVARSGYAVVKPVEYAFDASGKCVVKLVETKLVAGRVKVPAGLSPKGLVVQPYALPGIATETDEKGGFLLDHVPPNLEPKLILVSLPAEYTHRSVSAHPGQEVEIEVTRACQISGTVVDTRSGQIPQLAIVQHPHGPRGQETFRLDEFGRFFLVNVPAGKVVIEAYSGISRTPGSPHAEVELEFAPGESKQDVAIQLK